jgi:membrane protein YdbS with pleckstrin-like domain
MNEKGHRQITAGVISLLIAVGFAWLGFTANDPSPYPALSFLALAIVLFIVSIILIAAGLRGHENVRSNSLLRKTGTLLLAIGIIVLGYAGVAFFLIQNGSVEI